LPALTSAFKGIVDSQKLLALVADGDRRGRTATPDKPQPPAPATDKLVARIFSFSFHRGGPPKDETGHGGGFVFDARSLPNPGREERFKSLTGKDTPVIDYLRQHKSVDEYLKNAEALVDASISNYQSRGFKSLTASFGCTGGQHRSVYLAEQLAKHLRAKDEVEVVLHHIELEKMELEKMGR
jgi:RNase adaptor protein for sRNA GlmZ degradation